MPPSKSRYASMLAVLVAVVGVALGLAATSTAAARKQIVITTGYTGTPPAKLGSFMMTPFGPDAYADGDPVCSLPAPWTYQGVLGPQGDLILGDTCDFEALTVPTTWNNWSHGYTGRVYADPFVSNVETLTMPSQTGAFYTYVEANFFGTWEICADGLDVLGRSTSACSFVTTAVPVGGAQLFGVSMPYGGQIKSVTISVDDGGLNGGFAIGELAIAGPKLSKVT